MALFPGVNFILLDSDCLPVTLFEAADLWREGYLTRFPPGTGKAMPTKHPLHRKQVYLHDPRVVYTQQRVNESKAGQGVLLVTEPFSELNAGLIVIFGSSHPPLFHWVDWTRRCRCLPDGQYDEMVSNQAEQLEELFFARMGEFLTRTLGEGELTPVEKQYWIQSGLALLPLMATCTQYSLDFCLAWALIGEWTSRDMDMLLRSCLSIAPGVPALLPGPGPLSNKVPCHLFSCCKGWFPSLHCQGTKCFSLLASIMEDIGLLSSMLMVVPKWGWPRPYDQLLVGPFGCGHGWHQGEEAYVGRLGVTSGHWYHGGHQSHASAIGGQGSRLTALMLEKVGPPISAAVCSQHVAYRG